MKLINLFKRIGIFIGLMWLLAAGVVIYIVSSFLYIFLGRRVTDYYDRIIGPEWDNAP